MTQSHQLNNTGKNELSGYKLFEKTCAETDQDRWHRQEVLRQNGFVIEATRGKKKHTIIKILLLEIYLSNGQWLNRLAQNYFLSLPISLLLMYQ